MSFSRHCQQLAADIRAHLDDLLEDPESPMPQEFQERVDKVRMTAAYNDPINNTAWVIATMSGPKLAALASELDRLSNLASCGVAPISEAPAQTGAGAGSKPGAHSERPPRIVIRHRNAELVEFIAFGENASLKLIGAFRIRHLLRHPGKRIEVLELAFPDLATAHNTRRAIAHGYEGDCIAVESGASLQLLTDKTALDDMKSALKRPDLTAEEREFIQQHLNQVRGPDGRIRAIESRKKKAVRATRAAIRSAISRIKQTAPRMAEHLDAEIEVEISGGLYGRKSPLQWDLRDR